MCDCRADIEKKLTERFVGLAPEATGHEVELKGYAIIFGDSLSSKGYMPMELTATFPIKKGGTKKKTEKQNMIFSYCPFCGESYNKAAA